MEKQTILLAVVVALILAAAYYMYDQANATKSGAYEGYSAALVDASTRSAQTGWDTSHGVVGGIRPRTLKSTHRSQKYNRGPMMRGGVPTMVKLI